jgi:hypothetical protein
MKPESSRTARLAALSTACLLLLASGSAVSRAQQGSEESVEVRELRAALKVAQDQAAAERKRADGIEAQRKVLAESLAEAVRVSEEQAAAAREHQLTLQSFGVDLFTKDENSLEKRLLKAVRDLDIAQQELERRSAVLHRLSESFLKVLKDAPDLGAPLRTEAEKVLAEANAALSEGEEGADPVTEISRARIVSIDAAIGLVVFDAGRESGLRVGTPVTIHRGDRPLYSALVVDVRDAVSGAVLQDRMAGAGEVEVGDSIRLLPQQNSL